MEGLKGCIKTIKELKEQETTQLYNLLSLYFDGISKDNFYNDLYEKDYIIILYIGSEDTPDIKGFSTIKVIGLTYNHIQYGIVFSGDTIVAQKYWGTLVLPKFWTALSFGLKNAFPDRKWYWLLISSGFRTYRFLPVFFKEFYPSIKNETPPNIQNLMNYITSNRYGSDYDASKGIIEFSHSNERLKKGVSEISEDRLKNKHIRFFLEKNPNWHLGDELVCITEIKRENYTKAGQRLFDPDISFVPKVSL